SFLEVIMQKQGTDIERQVDSFFVDRLSTDQSFARWFWQTVQRQCGKLPPFTGARAVISPPRRFARGQTDIGLYSISGPSAAVLIENKVRHRFEDRQPERYRDECTGLVSDPADGCQQVAAV